MPRVPTYDEPQVSLRPVAGTRVAPVETGNPLLQAGQALERASDPIAKQAAFLQDQQNADRVFQAEGKLKTDLLQFENGLRDRRGQNAWGSTDEANQWWDNASKQYVEGLENDTQRRIFGNTLQQLRQSSIATVSRFEGEQRKIAQDESARSSILGSINLAASHHRDPVAVASAKDDVLNRAAVLSRLNGWSAEVRAAQETQFLTNFHKQIIQAKLDVDPEGAKAYFDANRAEIAGADHAEIEKVVGESERRTKAQTVADAIMAQGLSRSAALAEVRSKHAGQDEDEIITRVQQRYAEQDAAKAAAERDAANAAWAIYARTGKISEIPTELLNRVDGRTLIAMKSDQRAALSGSQIPTDWNRFYELKQMASTDPAAFAQLDLRQDFGRLAPEERRSLMTMQENVRKPDTARDVATLEQQLNKTHDVLGWKSSDAEKRGQFDASVYRELDSESKQLGRKLTYEERQKVIDRLLIEGEVASGKWWAPDSDHRFYEVTDTDEAADFVPSIPKTERTKIESALQRAGVVVNDANVMALYKRKNGLP